MQNLNQKHKVRAANDHVTSANSLLSARFNHQ